ncbi:MAG: hypothetical protein ACYS0D_04180 [Planctomycetota bacterium]|jgi:hypothetical protein
MITNNNRWKIATGFALAGFVGLAIVGCNTGGQPAAPGSEVAAGMLASDEGGLLESAGAQLWAENCIRCHNIRPPASLSDRQWQIVMQHMRVRANLTAREHEQILRFLQAAN